MDTTYIEYEIRKLRELVAELVAGKATPTPTPPAPKFWTFWTAEPEKGEERNFCFYHHSSFDTPIYGFTREMLIAMIREYVAQQYFYVTDFVDDYLKSNGGV